jgi:hypothetical protein
MNIIIMNSWWPKFATDIKAHWESLGHKVIVNPPWDAMLEADITFCYVGDNNAVEASTKPRKGKLFVQGIDIEVYTGQTQAVTWKNVDGAIFMSQHIKDMVNIGTTPYRVIKPGVDVSKWTLKPNKEDTPVRRIAYVVGDRRIWDVKRLDIAFMMLRDLIDSGKFIWQLHIRGTYSSHAQYNAYCQYLEKDLKLEGHVFWYKEHIEDLNSWLDDKDFLLLPSTKEAFSYITAQAMCKGIKPILNNWQGSKETWGKYVSDTHTRMLMDILQGEYKPSEYRQYIVDHYSEERYLNDLDNFILKGGD